MAGRPSPAGDSLNLTRAHRADEDRKPVSVRAPSFTPPTQANADRCARPRPRTRYPNTRFRTNKRSSQRPRRSSTADRTPCEIAERFGTHRSAHNGTGDRASSHYIVVTLTTAARRKRRPLFGNDPSAGSPTETLLRLLLPPKHAFCLSSRARAGCCHPARLNPTGSRYVPVGSSDGRCVQRAGT